MQYRLSAAYEAAVTLIESSAARSGAGLAGSRHGVRSDQGFAVTGGPDAAGFRRSTRVVPPNQQPSVVLGDVVTITGVHLDGTNVAGAVSTTRCGSRRSKSVPTRRCDRDHVDGENPECSQRVGRRVLYSRRSRTTPG